MHPKKVHRMPTWKSTLTEIFYSRRVLAAAAAEISFEFKCHGVVVDLNRPQLVLGFVERESTDIPPNHNESFFSVHDFVLCVYVCVEDMRSTVV
mmetsp:Transcript_12794/g.19463  ORF Transcript_12794/g.19463 Transcript_12794/m.19463 type:complete len:94 (-) Transcript_12794:32-313(-)